MIEGKSLQKRHSVRPRGSRLVFYGAAFFMLASVFAFSSCSSVTQTPLTSPAISPLASPFVSVSPGTDSSSSAQAPSASPAASVPGVDGTSSTPLPTNPVRLFYLSFLSDTEANRTAFEHALSKSGIDALHALMELCEMDAYLSKAPLSVGSLLFEANAYNGALSAPQGTGSLNPDSGQFTFSYASGSALYGVLEENRMGCYALDSGGGFVYMVRMEKIESGWLVCVDTADRRILAQWGDTNRFVSFSNMFDPYLPQTSQDGASSWGASSPVINFAVENWYDFSWDALSSGAVTIFSVAGEKFTVSSAP